MTIRRLGRPWMRPEGSAELAQQTSRREERSSKVAPREVYHRETQIGPCSESEREIALQTSSLERSERAFDEFCRKVQEEDRNDQARPEDDSSLRNGPKTGVADEEEDLSLGGDTSVELAAMYRKYCAVSSEEERNRKDGAARTLPIRESDQSRESRIAPKATGAGPVEAFARFDEPKMEIHEALIAQDRVKERSESLKRTKSSIEKKRLRWENALKSLDQVQRAREVRKAPQTKVMEIENDMLLWRESEKKEQEQSQRIEVSTGPHQVGDTPVHNVAMSTNSADHGRYQAEDYDEWKEKHKESLKEWGDRAKETIPRALISRSRYRRHHERQLKRSIPDVPNGGEKRINQKRNALHKETRDGGAVETTEAPTPTESISPNLTSRSKGEADSGKVEKNSGHDEPNAPSVSTPSLRECLDHQPEVLAHLEESIEALEGRPLDGELRDSNALWILAFLLLLFLAFFISAALGWCWFSLSVTITWD